eukprot:TRINITY_DN24370_c0_g1_i1.p1 TRINITY_DN24370_c0_g1~~TRINITY_DN24370_c0_g1_i1.p1  ORF type:complete len:350 (+),score=69.03 TRINITY_DN24370_c0_g1_i1:51-1052(+)
MTAFPVCVKFLAGAFHKVTVEPTYNMGKLTSLVGEATGADMSKLHLVYESDILFEMSTTVEQLGLKRGSLLTVVSVQKVKAEKKLENAGLKPTGRCLRSMAGRNELEHVKDLVRAGVALNGQSESSGNTPLIISAAMGHWKITRVLISGGADLEMTDRQGCTALFHAAVHLRLKTLNLIIDFDGEVNTGNNEGVPPLTVVSGLRHEKAFAVAELLIRYGAIVYNPALINAIESDNVDIVRILLSTNPNLDIETALALVDPQLLNFKEITSLLEERLPANARTGGLSSSYRVQNYCESECSDSSSDSESTFSTDSIPFHPISSEGDSSFRSDLE